MLKFGRIVTKYKKLILILAIVLLIPSVLGMKATRVNYDILVYLPDDIETVKGEDILADEFNMGAYSILIVNNMPTKDILNLEDKIKNVESVDRVASIADVFGSNIPTEMLPEEVKDAVYKDNSTIIFVTFDDNECNQRN